MGPGHVAYIKEKENMDGVFIANPEGRRPPARPKNRGDDNIKTDLK
jgi:hypothetical protein